MNEKLKKALEELENDNAEELNAITSEHRFSRNFDRRAMAVCRGETAAVHRKPVFRRLPLCAAVLLIFLMCAFVTSCAVVVYNYLTRYIPGYGITDVKSDVSLYATEESFSVGDMEIETVLYVGDKDGGKLYLWAKGPTLGGWDNLEWMKDPLFNIIINEITYPIHAVSGSLGTSVSEYQCEVAEIPFDDEVIIVRNDSETEIKLTNQTNHGYTVEEWGEFDGISIKVLPLYVNNRIVFVETEGTPHNSHVSATVTLHDSLGNKVSSGSGSQKNDGFMLTMPRVLPEDIIKIEVDSLRVSVPVSGSYSIPIPQKDESVDVDIALLDTDIFSERITQIRRDGNDIYITTKIDAHKYQPLTDLSIIYNSPNSTDFEYYSTTGIDIFTYRLTLTDEADTVTLIPNRYTYIIRNGENPLCSIKIK